MKKLFVIAMAFGLAACSTDKTDTPSISPGDVEANYLSVNLTTTMGSRANYDSDNGYQEGEEAETQVNKVRFYFFKDGKAAIVDYDKSASYKDWIPSDEIFPDGEPDMPNVEHSLQTTLILETIEHGVNTPTHLLAVLNPNDAVDALGNTPSLEEVKAYVADLTDHEGGFVMTNSAYVDKDGNIQNVNSLDGHLMESKDAAEANPVTIYVERVVAKLDMAIKSAATGGEITVKEISGDNGKTRYLISTGETFDDKEVFAEFLGYNITATANTSYLVKSINDTKEWNNELTDTNLFKTKEELWNYDMFFRSFWAANPAGVTYSYGTWNKENTTEVFPEGAENTNPALGNEFKFDGSSNTLYIPENAGESLDKPANAHPTQVIIGARLVDEEGNEIEIAEFAGHKVSVASLKDALLNSMSTTYWREVAGQEGEDKYKTIDVDDIEFVTAMSLDESLNDWQKSGRYYVYAQLTQTAKGYTWYNAKPEADGDNADKASNAEAVDASLKNLGAAKIWKEGQTYYYFNIRHLSAEENDSETPGYYGVVRNHIYSAQLNTLAGLGTPVYNPDEIIYPEYPDEEFVYLAAEIKILSWRVVDHDVDLVW